MSGATESLPKATQFLKQCSKCRKQKWSTEFNKSKSGAQGLNARCKECEYDRHEKEYQNNLKNVRAKNLQRKFGITEEDYETIFEEQNGVCAICNQPETAKINNKIKMLAVDHYHPTGKIRGLLCQKCNHALGLFKDNIEILKQAIKYLENNQQ